MKLLLWIGGGVVAFVVLALIAVNMLISADAVRDRVAARVKEQTGRDLTVNGSTSLLLAPSPHIVLTDVEIVDPKNRQGADLKVARLALDVSFGQMFSREVDAKRVVMERPVFTVRLKPQTGGMEQQGDAGTRPERHAEAPLRVVAAGAALAATRRDIMLNDVQIEDGTVRIIYDENGAERRIEKINANLSLPHLVDPLTAKGDFDWKDTRVGFDLKLTSPADLDTRTARLELALDTDAIDAKFDGNIASKPAFSAEGDLTAKSQSVPSLLAWMRKEPPTETSVGSGELSSHIAWQPGEITFTQARFALTHATGQGQAVVTLKSPRPHLRAAFAVETLDLNPFLAANGGPGSPQGLPGPARQTGDSVGLADPAASSANAGAPQGAEPPRSQDAAPAAAPKGDRAAAPSGSPADRPNVVPAAFDADVNVNVRETKISRMTIGPTSIGLSLREGVLDATLGGMQIYDGQGSGKITVDASKPVAIFNGNLQLDNVSVQPLLLGAAGFNLLAGRTNIALQLSGTGGSGDEIKQSLTGRGSIDITDGSIEGINLTELIQGVGAGQMPNLEQGPGAKTAFSSLGGTFTIASGVAESHDLEMTSPLLKVTGRGTVDLVTSSLDFLTQPEIVAGPEGKGGANNLAGLSIPVRIEGPFEHPTFKPELKDMFSSPEQASKTINQIGDVLQKKLKGKPVGEAIGRILGGVRIGNERSDGGGADTEGPASQAEPDGEDEAPEESDQGRDPDLDNILR